ncbi:MAG: Beta-lactamase superfamily domain protein [Candidatus Scalindua rubra]|uniref:Beta-lactamase superfamily domain protein n=1 Tax=Candidatus Scalindua rubra TaxID=1872076 RepID=A0A1E3XA03_9BACT|nr:MAG: Beta-lactamase superfamily domain protein [Candidatus Scalindua rubra]
MKNGITLKILGDYGPFSKVGKSIGYQVNVGQSSYMVDCGAPLFQQVGGNGLKEINGVIITHCHDDHKRWFTDLALFHMYAPDISHKLTLLTTEAINEELRFSSGSALNNSLSICRKKVVDIAYEDYVNFQMIGPYARYKIVSKDEGGGKTGLYITDRDGNIVAPDKAKIVISRKTGRPRMLFKDPDYREWVEPESFYPFSSDVFYEKSKNNYINNEEGYTIEAIKAPVWHGILGIGIRIRSDEEALVFSSDTVNDKVLWKQLYMEKKKQNFNDILEEEFESASVIYGDINDYIERVWGEERYREAVNAFNDAVVIHDISVRNSVVHTDYEGLDNTFLKKDKTILTHSPDEMTSEWVLSEADKTFIIKGKAIFEKVGNKLFPMNADIYHKKASRYYVGYKNEKGKYTVYEKDGLLRLSNDYNFNGTPLCNIDLYEDISGKYYKKLDGEDAIYLERVKGRVELIKFTEDGSRGQILNGHKREILTSNRKSTQISSDKT